MSAIQCMSPSQPDPLASMAGRSGRARPVQFAVAVAMAFGVSHQAMSQSATDSDVQALKSELQQLRRKIDRLEAQQATQNAPHPETEVKQTPVISGEPPVTSRAPLTTSTPAVKAGPLTLTFGGFVAGESVYRKVPS